ncbi:MAG: endonuclease III [Verrucomicrobiota bacterium]|jgi:endonuclease-3
MPRESKSARLGRVGQIVSRLRAAYPDAHCELNFSSPLDLLVATILSAQCTDKQVNIVTADLFRKYRTAADYAAAPAGQLESDVRRIGLYRNKARNIRAACQALVSEHGGLVPTTLEELVQLAGVGRKTANVVLGNAFHIQSGVVVDTHVQRLAGRLRLSSARTPEKIEQDLMGLFPREEWALASHWLIWHGRRRCRARNPDCGSCELRDLCPSAAT